MRSIPPALLTAIDSLPRPISITIDCYVHTLDSQLNINKISCLESLRVCMVNQPRMNYGYFSHDYFGKNVSKGVAEIVRQNPRTKALHLCLQKSLHTSFHGSYQEVRDHALEQIGRTVPELDALSLESDFLVSDVAWSHLQSLSIANMPLIETVISQLTGHLPALRKLKLSAYESLDCFPHRDFHEGVVPIKAFLSGLNLTHLSLLGFHPDVLLAAVSSASPILQNIRFHIREN